MPALNADVEASRSMNADEDGFGVVASEIKPLSEALDGLETGVKCPGDGASGMDTGIDGLATVSRGPGADEVDDGTDRLEDDDRSAVSPTPHQDD